MKEKLEALMLRFAQIEGELENPAVCADRAAYARLLKEHRRLSPIIEKLNEFRLAEALLSETELLLTDPDPELRLLASLELPSAKENAQRLSEELTLLLLPRDPNDEKNVIIEIRAGAGGEEAALFSAVLYRMYSMYASAMGYRLSLLRVNETELGGFKEISFAVEGDGAYSRFKFESGVHRIQRVPVTESSGRIQTSTATVAVLPEVEEVDVPFNLTDCIFESCKSSGAGGQHINKTESAVRLTHKPSGIVIEVDQERSQFQNKDRAIALLRAKLYAIAEKERNDKIASDRKSQIGTGDRSERIRTYNYRENRVTDHRISLTLYSLDSCLNGNIDPLINALLSADTAEKLAASKEI